jgi:hypothetical protein
VRILGAAEIECQEGIDTCRDGVVRAEQSFKDIAVHRGHTTFGR